MVLVVGVIVAAALRVVAGLDDFWLDEIWTWVAVTQVQSATQIFTEFRYDNNHLLNTWIIYLLGTECHWFFYRIPAVVAGIGTVVLCGLTARRWGRVEAVTAMVT